MRNQQKGTKEKRKQPFRTPSSFFFFVGSKDKKGRKKEKRQGFWKVAFFFRPFECLKL